ncbi:MAG TPA: hypothetical protein PK109_03600 [Candidatus Paceibacterota bacterium]|nr:hypothetical protein [Candidatus Paceibacterota bacterium]
MPFKFELRPAQRAPLTVPGFEKVETAELREDALIINGVTHPLVEWLYPVASNPTQIVEPTLIFKNTVTGQDTGIPLSLLEKTFGQKVPLPIGDTWPGK